MGQPVHKVHSGCGSHGALRTGWSAITFALTAFTLQFLQMQCSSFCTLGLKPDITESIHLYISFKLLHVVVPQLSLQWKEQSLQMVGGLEIQRHKAKVCIQNVSTVAQVLILFIYKTISIAPAQHQ